MPYAAQAAWCGLRQGATYAIINKPLILLPGVNHGVSSSCCSPGVIHGAHHKQAWKVTHAQAHITWCQSRCVSSSCCLVSIMVHITSRPGKSHV
eukprot:276187-Pelagomonas_calceolata.AAC.11